MLAAVIGTVRGQQIRPINLTLCEEINESVSRFMTDVYVVQPQQNQSCPISVNTSSPVVSINASQIGGSFNLQEQMFLVSTSAPMANPSTPVVVTARSGRSVQTWRIPLELPQLDDYACACY